jgi:hypothetical protein
MEDQMLSQKCMVCLFFLFFLGGMEYCSTDEHVGTRLYFVAIFLCLIEGYN